MSKDEKKNPTAVEAKATEAEFLARIQQLEAEKAAAEKKSADLEAEMKAAGVTPKKEEEPHFVNATGQRIPSRFKGTKTYRLTAPHYRAGVLFEAGDHITVTDEKPSVTWVEVKKSEIPESTAVTVAPPIAVRASDTAI